MKHPPEYLSGHADLHPEAASLLSLINYPDLLETMPLADIHAMFRRSGYSQEDFGNVTIGWGVKAGDKSLATSSIIQTTDNKIVYISTGSSGHYCMDIIVEDAAKPTTRGIESIVMMLQFAGSLLSKKVKAFCREHFTDAIIQSGIRGTSKTLESVLNDIKDHDLADA